MKSVLLVLAGALAAFLWMVARCVWVFGGKDFLLGERHKKNEKKKK